MSLSVLLVPDSPPLTAITPNKPEFFNNEAVPFRFTPNLQRFITPIGTEGLLTSSVMAIARCLTESEVSSSSIVALSSLADFSLSQYDFEHRLSIFIREEILMIAQMSKVDLRPNLRELVLNNVDQVVRRARVMSCKMERDRVSLTLLVLCLR